MNEINYEQIFTGFEFNMGWFILFSDSMPQLTNPEQLSKLSPEQLQETITPLLILYKDLLNLVKVQGGLDFIETQAQQSDTPQQAE